MRVLFVNTRRKWQSEWGGDSTQVVETKRALEQLGISVDIAEGEVAASDVTPYDLVHIFNIQTAITGERDLVAAKKAGKPVALSPIYWDLRHLLRETSRLFPRNEKFVANLLGKLHWRLPFFVRAVRTVWKQRKIYPAARRMLALANVLLPNSYAEMEALVWTFNAPSLRQKAFVVPNGVSDRLEVSSLSSLSLRVQLPHEYVLEVGRLEPTKGQLSLIRALSAVPDIPLVFVGRGQDTLYGRECMRLGLTRGNTFFLGEMPHDQLSPIYSRAKVHALPSLRESPGLATLEAAVHGCNCVVSIHGPALEYFGQDVWYCDPSDVVSIRSAVLEAWVSPRTGRLRDRVLAHFTWLRAAEATLAAYNWVLERKAVGAERDSMVARRPSYMRM